MLLILDADICFLSQPISLEKSVFQVQLAGKRPEKGYLIHTLHLLMVKHFQSNLKKTLQIAKHSWNKHNISTSSTFPLKREEKLQLLKFTVTDS